MDWFHNRFPLAQLNRLEFIGALVATGLFLVLAFSLTHYGMAAWQLERTAWLFFLIRLVPLLLAMVFFQGITSLLAHLKADKRLRGDALRLYLLARLRRLLMLVSLPALAGGLVYGISLVLFHSEITGGMTAALAGFFVVLLANRAFPVPTIHSDEEIDIVQGARLLSYEAAQHKATQRSQDEIRLLFPEAACCYRQKRPLVMVWFGARRARARRCCC